MFSYNNLLVVQMYDSLYKSCMEKLILKYQIIMSINMQFIPDPATFSFSVSSNKFFSLYKPHLSYTSYSLVRVFYIRTLKYSDCESHFCAFIMWPPSLLPPCPFFPSSSASSSFFFLLFLFLIYDYKRFFPIF